MNHRRPFVVLPFRPRGQEFVPTQETTTSANGPTMPASVRLPKRGKHENAVRFFQDIHGLVTRGRHDAPQLVACASSRGVPVGQIAR